MRTFGENAGEDAQSPIFVVSNTKGVVMYTSVVCIPTFRRTEMLALCLERISAAKDAPDDIRIFLDHSFPERLVEVEFVRDLYCPRAQIFHAKPHILCP